MNVFSINGSPRMESGNTAPLLNAFVDGMKGAGANVELFYAKKLNIKPCTGEFSCWGDTPAKCHIQDDMQALIKKLEKADIWVLGIPVYVPMPGEMQNFLNRLMPIFESKVVLKGGNMYPHKRSEVRLKSMVLVSTSSFWQMENFDDITGIIKRVSKIMGSNFFSILRPQADLFKSRLKTNADCRDILSATRDAGKQMILKGKISKKTMDRISKPLVPMKTFLEDFEIV